MSLVRHRSSSFGDRTCRGSGSELVGLQYHIRREIMHLFCAMVFVMVPVSIGSCFLVASGGLMTTSHLGDFRFENYTLIDSSRIERSSSLEEFVEAVDNRELIALEELEPLPRLIFDPQVENGRDGVSPPVKLMWSEFEMNRRPGSNVINEVAGYTPDEKIEKVAASSLFGSTPFPSFDGENKLQPEQSSTILAAEVSTSITSIPDTTSNRVKPFLLDLDRQHKHSPVETSEHEDQGKEISTASFAAVTGPQDELHWLEFPLVENETEYLMEPFYRVDKSGCLNVRTHRIHIIKGPPGFDSSRGSSSSSSNEARSRVRLAAGFSHEITLASIGEEGKQQCVGGDYFETNLVGPRWKSRPPVLDHNNGTYSIKFQLHPRFAGVHTFTITLLFANYEGLNRYPARWARMETILSIDIEFFLPDVIHPVVDRLRVPRFLRSSSASSYSGPTASLPNLTTCKRQDFNRKYWAGRWTREQEYECPANDGSCMRMDGEFFGDEGWSRGLMYALESEGWVYSAHCAFKIFKEEAAWQCLNNKWLYFWGDSNMQDTIRNLLNFVLGFNHTIPYVPRIFDESITSPNDGGKYSVRITNTFNGHHEVDKNWEGLSSLLHPEYQTFVRSYFQNDIAPDFLIMNSGLHDGLFWKRVEQFLRDGVEQAWKFWNDIWQNMKAKMPMIIYCSTVAAGGQQRTLSMNPQKMEFYNHLLKDKLTQLNLTEQLPQFIDAFDITYPWHYDHRTNDGVHYGRAPLHKNWAANGQIRRKYFVDLMVGHVYLNAICAT